MNIVLLHGDDFLASKKRLDSLLAEIKRKGFSVFYIAAEGKLGLSEQLSARSLFEKDSLYILENANKIPLKDLQWLSSHAKALAGTLVIYSEGFVGARVKNLLPKEVKEETFKLPPLIFSFLDSFYPGNSLKSMQLLYRLAPSEPMEKIMHFLGKHLRNLYWVGQDPKLLPYSQDWRVLKTLTQSKKFKKGELEETIGDLAEADIASKTSDASTLGLLDQIIASRLE